MQGIKCSSNTNQEKSVETGYEGTLQLVGAMFRLAAQDLKYGTGRVKKSARIFIDSPWFSFLCDGMNVESSYVKKLIKGSRVRKRNNYE